ncbi:MAG: RIP metalloprotease RseP [Bacteroidales bacterium]|nr:RIP metalloprotease RseP [Bacteroidales bacterium]
MIVLIKAAQLLLSLSILVIIHEFGHFTFAKLFKTRVEKFYLFFNPWFSLFKFKRGETEYGLGWLPLGGYVKISGMIDESMDKEQLAKEPQPYEFRAKPSVQRLLIMLGGVMFNIIFAFLIYSMTLFAWGEKFLPTENVKFGIVCDTLALDMGLQHGDKILSLDNEKVADFHDIIPEIVYNGAKSIQVDRKGSHVDIVIPDDFIARFIETRSFMNSGFPFVIAKFEKGSEAEESGLKVDDRITGINGKETIFYEFVGPEIKQHKNGAVTVQVDRNGVPLEFAVNVSAGGTIGIHPTDPAAFFVLEEKHYGFLASIPAGTVKGVKTIKSYLKDLKLVFTPETGAYKSLGGFIAIGNIFPGQWNWKIFWNMTAFLSIMLAVLNILPIPALDGGHVLFLLFEIVTGKKASDKFMEIAQIAGMIMLLALVLYANGNDIIKIFTQ